MAAAFTGVHLSHPAFAPAPVPLLPSACAAAGLSATALASVPPNQAARPTSCSERDTVLRAIGNSLECQAMDPPGTQAVGGQTVQSAGLRREILAHYCYVPRRKGYAN